MQNQLELQDMDNVLVCTSVLEPSRGRNVTNNKVGRGLLATTVKIYTLRSCVAEGEAQLTLGILLKGPIKGQLSRPRRAPILLQDTLPLVCKSKGMEAMKVRSILMAMMIVVGMQVATRTTPIKAKIRVLLRYNKISRLCGYRRWMR